jgi:hypothetical protein
MVDFYASLLGGLTHLGFKAISTRIFRQRFSA